MWSFVEIFLFQFLVLLYFTWMSIVSYVVFKTTTSIWTKIEERRHRKVFVGVGIAVPLSVMTATFLVEFSTDNSGSLDFLRPDFGVDGCFFGRGKQVSSIVFFHFPVLIILLSTVYFLLLALSRRWDQRADPVRTGFKNQFSTSVKIFLIVAINWIFELASFVTEWKSNEKLATAIAYASALSSLAQGFLIFVVLVSDKNVSKILARKFFGIQDGGDDDESRRQRHRLNSLTPIEVDPS